MKKTRSALAILTVLMMVAVLIPTTAFAATPNKCPKCFSKYKTYYTICDRIDVTRTYKDAYTLWVPVGKPVQNCDKKSKKLYFSAGKSTTVTYEVSGTFKYANVSLGTKYTKSKSQTTGVTVPTADIVKPKYYAQMYIGTNLHRYDVTAKHSLRCFKCGYNYKKNYKTEKSVVAVPLKSQTLKTKTKVSSKAADVKYSEKTYYGCRGKCGK